VFQSPFLDANPSYASLLTSAAPSKATLEDGEYVYLCLFDDRGRPLYESSIRPVKTGFGDFSEVPLAKFSSRPKKAWLFFLKVYNGRWYRSGRRVHWVYPKGGPGQIPSQDYGASVNASRRDVRRKVQLPSGKRTVVPRSSTIRPSPEIKTRVRQNFSEGNNGGYFFSPSISTETAYTRSWSGVRTPGYGKIPKKQRPVNPHSVFLEDVTDAGLIEMFDIPSTGIYFNQYSAFTRRYNPPAAPLHDTVAQSKAVKKLIQRIEQGIEGNLAQDVVQIRQTIKLITDTAQRLAKAGIALKNGNIPTAIKTIWGATTPNYGGRKRKGPDHTRTAADNWLQMQYGWKPLLMDLHGSMEALAKLNLADASIKQVTASAQTSRWDVSDLGLATHSPTVAGWTRVHTTSRCKYGVRFTVESHLLAFLAQSGFLNPINLVWETIPFSFVADWFLPIGPWLETLHGYPGLVFFDGYQTLFTKQQMESFVRYAGESAPGSGQMLQTSGSYGREVVRFDRTRLNTLPVNSFPSFKNPFSFTHAANALALLKRTFR
jgi:hypothetical protein